MNKDMDLLVEKYDIESDLAAIWSRIVRETGSCSLASEVCDEIERRRKECKPAAI